MPEWMAVIDVPKLRWRGGGSWRFFLFSALAPAAQSPSPLGRERPCSPVQLPSQVKS